MNLDDFFAQNPVVALAFSGGVDSSYLLYAALQSGAKVRAYYVKSAFQPEFEWADARRLAAQLGADLQVIPADILACPDVSRNDERRCYACKKALFSLLKQRAEQDGYPILIDGTNDSDSADDRPGMQALRELGVRSPLRECGIGKAQIRQLSRAAGLFTWDKPAYACLATRIPTGTPITGAMLERVEQAERILFDLGFTDFRVRVLGDAARLQLKAADLTVAVARRHEIRRLLAPWFTAVLLDLTERSEAQA